MLSSDYAASVEINRVILIVAKRQYATMCNNKAIHISHTTRDGRMSRAFISGFGRSKDLDLTFSNPYQVKSMAFKLIFVAS